MSDLDPKTTALVDILDSLDHDGGSSIRSAYKRLNELSEHVYRTLAGGEEITQEDRDKAWRHLRYCDSPAESEMARMILLLDPEQRAAHGLLSLLVQTNPGEHEFYMPRTDLWSFKIPAPVAEYGWRDDIHVSWCGAGEQGEWWVHRGDERGGRDAKRGTSPLLRAALTQVVTSHDAWTARIEREVIANVLEAVPDYEPAEASRV